MFLSQDELARLTGKRRPTAQARWLDAHGYPYAPGPVVLRDVVVARLGGGTKVAIRGPQLRLN